MIRFLIFFDSLNQNDSYYENLVPELLKAVKSFVSPRNFKIII
jgi:hypothetical protein